MNNLTRALLGSAALCALTNTPAAAQAHQPNIHVTALHAGRSVNKTKRYHCKAHSHTSSCRLYVYTDVSASDYRKRVWLAMTYYKFNNSSMLCSSPETEIKAYKKSTYGRIRTGTETYSFGCPSGPTKFYGDIYELKDPSGFGQTDNFESLMTGTVHVHGGTYKDRLILDVLVSIGTE
jgi:hypothetical protein